MQVGEVHDGIGSSTAFACGGDWVLGHGCAEIIDEAVESRQGRSRSSKPKGQGRGHEKVFSHSVTSLEIGSLSMDCLMIVLLWDQWTGPIGIFKAKTAENLKNQHGHFRAII
jgi:hypothetical protein